MNLHRAAHVGSDNRSEIMLSRIAHHANKARLATRLLALWKLVRHRDTPRAPKLIALLVLAYALSPIDLIPDFIPVLGYLDDLLLLPLGIALAIKLMPRGVWEDCKSQARAQLGSELPRNRTAVIVIVTFWLALLSVVVWLAWRSLEGN